MTPPFTKQYHEIIPLIKRQSLTNVVVVIETYTVVPSGEVYSIQHYVIKFVSALRQVGAFLRAFRFPLPIRLTATI